MKEEMIYLFFITWKMRDHKRLNNCPIMNRATDCLVLMAVTLLECADTQVDLREHSGTYWLFTSWLMWMFSSLQGIPTSPPDSEVLKLRSPKWLHQLETLRSCPCVTSVVLALCEY